LQSIEEKLRLYYYTNVFVERHKKEIAVAITMCFKTLIPAMVDKLHSQFAQKELKKEKRNLLNCSNIGENKSGHVLVYFFGTSTFFGTMLVLVFTVI
jgi:hypothetical protein